jgi:pyrroloquinoline quinone biosynthesis protein B
LQAVIRVRARVLGSAAGGGLPQWNCGCARCDRARFASHHARTQDSLAILGSSGAVVCNASPDLGRQIAATPELWPRGVRDTPIAAVILTNGDLDHVLGLFSLRESQPFAIYATEAVRRGLVEHNAMCRTLDRFAGQTVWRDLDLDVEIEIAGPDGEPTGIEVQPFALPGRPPLHLAGLVEPSAEHNVGLRITDANDAELVYAPNAAYLDASRFTGSGVVLFDGTFWSSDEPIRAGASTLRSEQMGHVPIAGPEGSLPLFPRMRVQRAIYTHINNTNPILTEGSAERRLVEGAGWEIAFDGMEIVP